MSHRSASPTTSPNWETPPRARGKPASDTSQDQPDDARADDDERFWGLLEAEQCSIQALVSDYERDKLRPYGDMVARFALALDVSADELLGIVPLAKTRATHNRRFLRRMQAMDKLPKRDQEALLRTIDAFLDRAKTG